jgi:hypothetical protein
MTRRMCVSWVVSLALATVFLMTNVGSVSAEPAAAAPAKNAAAVPAATQSAPAATAPAAAPATTAAAAPTEPGPDSFEAFAKKLKNPVPWFKWGGDMRLREHYANNMRKLNQELVGHEEHFQRDRTRVWATITPVQDFDINARLTWEFYNFCRPQGVAGTSLEDRRDTDFSEAIFDNLNVKWNNAFGLPSTLTAGRQDIMLGDGWLVMDGTPLDGSRTFFFDALRYNYRFDSYKTTVDTIFISQTNDTNQWLEPINHRKPIIGAEPVIEQDELGAIVWLSNKSIEKTELNGYVMYKNDNGVAANGDEGDIYTYGARAAGAIDDNWKYSAEAAQQLGHKKNFFTDQDMHDLCAFGLNSRLSYFLNDPLNNNFRLAYEFMSGDDPDTKTIEAFDPLWARWPRWSELYVYTVAAETRIGEITNLHRLGPGWSFNPCKKLEVVTDYQLLFADENTRAGNAMFSDNGLFRGELITAWLKYKFNPFISGHLVGEFFFPGNYYSDFANDPAVFLRYELTLTF